MTREIADHPKRPSRRLAAVVLGIFGVVGLGLGLGSASQVTLAANPLGAGATTVASCQTSGTIQASFTTAWTGTPATYRASSVTLSGIDYACDGKSVRAQIIGANPAMTERNGTLDIPAAGNGSIVLDFPGTPAAGPTALSITSVAIVIQ